MQTVIPICRICLENLDEYIDMETLFYSENTQGNLKTLTYKDCFRQCTHLNVEINGNVSQGICVPCASDLRFAYEFLKKVENAAKFYEEHAKSFFNELQIIPMDETEMTIEIEKVELDDTSSGTKEFSVTKTQSDEENTIYILEFKHPSSDGDNDHSDTDNTLKVIAMDNEKNNIDQLVYCVNKQEQMISTISKETTNKNTKISKRSHKMNKCYGRNNKYFSESSNICIICQSGLDDLDLTEHMEKCHMHIEKCQHCEYEDEEFKVRKHEKHKHANIDKYLCDICSKTYFTLGSFNAHLRFHKRKQSNFQSEACKICGKRFSVQYYLRQHLETHKNERKIYECDQCDNWYLSKYTLINHIKTHKGKTFKCLECDKRFSRQYELKIHMRFHTRIYPYNCEVCDQKFAIKSHLRSHMWRHQGLKLQCEDCPKQFTSSRSLKEHSFTHTQMPFPCCYCPKAYTTTYKYRGHLKSAHSIELNEEELQKVKAARGPVAKESILRKKLKLVPADSVTEKGGAKDEETGDFEDFFEEL